jgi:Family of unknown function (DUF6527)
MVRRDRHANLWDDVVGAFYWTDCDDAGNHYRMLMVKMPADGGEVHGIPIAPAVSSGWNKAAWTFDGNEDAPTLSPSIRYGDRNEKHEIVVEHWHGFIKAGRIESC